MKGVNIPPSPPTTLKDASQSGQSPTPLSFHLSQTATTLLILWRDTRTRNNCVYFADGGVFGSEWVSMDGVTWLFCHAHVHAVEERCYLVLCDLFGPRERSIFVPALRVFIEREILVIRRSVLCIEIRRDGNNNTYCMCFIITLLRTPSLPLVARSELQLI